MQKCFIFSKLKLNSLAHGCWPLLHREATEQMLPQCVANEPYYVAYISGQNSECLQCEDAPFKILTVDPIRWNLFQTFEIAAAISKIEKLFQKQDHCGSSLRYYSRSFNHLRCSRSDSVQAPCRKVLTAKTLARIGSKR